MRILVYRIIVTGFSLWVAALVVPGIHLTSPGASWQSNLWTIIVASVMFGLTNALVKPVATLLSLPLVVVTLGLFLVIINALMLEIAAWLSARLGGGLSVDSFWWDAVFGAVIISVTNAFTGWVFDE